MTIGLVVLFESPFTSVSTVNRGHPSLVSLVPAQQARQAAMLGRLGPLTITEAAPNSIPFGNKHDGILEKNR
jgi:hypothetical protein